MVPCRSDRGESRSTPAPWTRTLTPFAGFPSSVAWIVSLERTPTVVDRVPTVIAMQPCWTTAGMNGPLTSVVVLAVLFAVFVSASLPTTVARLNTIPGCRGVTAIVITTTLPLFIVPSWHRTRMPPVHVPWLVFTPANDTLPGSGSATTTPVAVSGALFRTVSVEVIRWPTVAGSGRSRLVIDRSIWGAGGAGITGGVG